MDFNSEFLLSGGGMSFLSGNRSGQFSYGYYSFKGKRASMEDMFVTSVAEVNGHIVACFGVFDGHGGARAAQYLKKNLFKNLISHPDIIHDSNSAIAKSFKQTDSDLLNKEDGEKKDCGSTAVIALLLDDRLIIANVGDSRAVGCKDGYAIPLSEDHKPERSDERQRIENAGGFLFWAGSWRVGGVLSVSRAFGDKQLKDFVIAEPEIQEECIEEFEFLIIASDGIWSVMSNEEAVNIVGKISDTEASARKLAEGAYSKGSPDNITCIVVRFTAINH